MTDLPSNDPPSNDPPSNDPPSNDPPSNDLGSHYFDRDPASVSEERRIEVTLPDVSFPMLTDRGVFSHGRVDTGTNLLLRVVPPPAPEGDLLDLGCGAGPIALTMAARAPGATVWAVDVNARARALCARNAAALGHERVRVVAPAEVPAGVRFATIWSNPPIRIGKTALHELLQTWLSRLAPGGSAVLVVQRHLGADSLRRWLTAEVAPTEQVASRAGYRVLLVRPA